MLPLHPSTARGKGAHFCWPTAAQMLSFAQSHRRKRAMSPFAVPTSAPPAKHVLSTSTMPPAQRFSYWLDMICSVYVQLDCDVPRDQPIFGAIETSRIGSIDVTQVRSNGQRIRRTPTQVRRSGEDYCLAMLLREGRGYSIQDGRTATMQPGDFVINDCTRPYELVFDSPHHDLFVVRVPRLHLESHLGNLTALTATTITAENPAGRLLHSTVNTLHATAGSVHPAACRRHGRCDHQYRRGRFAQSASRRSAQAVAAEGLSSGAGQDLCARPSARPGSVGPLGRRGTTHDARSSAPLVPRRAGLHRSSDLAVAAGCVPAGPGRSKSASPWHQRHRLFLGLQRRRPFQPQLPRALRSFSQAWRASAGD